MKKSILILAALLSVSTSSLARVVPASKLLAVAPPTGLDNSHSYGVYMHEQTAPANLEAMGAKLKPPGHKCFVLNNGGLGAHQPQPERDQWVEQGIVSPSGAVEENGTAPLKPWEKVTGPKFTLAPLRASPVTVLKLNEGVVASRALAFKPEDFVA